MILSKRIQALTTSLDFVFWVAAIGNNRICNLTRVSAFDIEDDKEHITFYLPEKLWKIIEPGMTKGSNLSFLLTSTVNFESYQVKGIYISNKECSKEIFDSYQHKVKRFIEVITGMGLNGKGLFNFLYGQPSIAVTFLCTEMYEQTPKPGTGEKIVE